MTLVKFSSIVTIGDIVSFNYIEVQMRHVPHGLCSSWRPPVVLGTWLYWVVNVQLKVLLCAMCRLTLQVQPQFQNTRVWATHLRIIDNDETIVFTKAVAITFQKWNRLRGWDLNFNSSLFRRIFGRHYEILEQSTNSCRNTKTLKSISTNLGRNFTKTCPTSYSVQFWTHNFRQTIRWVN